MKYDPSECPSDCPTWKEDMKAECGFWKKYKDICEKYWGNQNRKSN